MAFVLDNSVVSGWILETQATPYSEGIAGLLSEQTAVAPPPLCLEYTNVLRTAVKRRSLIAQTAQEMLVRLAKLPITIDSHPPELSLLFSLALRHDLTAYDAAYLELGLRYQLPMATQDVALAEAAIVAGIGVVQIQG
ncbi:MAG: type II toxin-antitoxin system VapC family toxin [Azoarcus sp.]|jgi:predicted nucleic acid-binding protein|nr:type II toxin-antitoxin system VapC family toxin [Azoarcus sp.]